MNLGDDNALHPGILSFADRTIREHDLDILSWRACAYFHPDWNIVYGPLPDRGNILGIDIGTTGQLYHCRSEAVVEHFCRELRLSGCFPCMLNLLFRKATADMVHERAGRFYWAPCADISSSYLMLGVARAGGYAYYDAFGAIGGRSRDSNLRPFYLAARRLSGSTIWSMSMPGRTFSPGTSRNLSPLPIRWRRRFLRQRK